jgi:hypothetical protein
MTSFASVIFLLPASISAFFFNISSRLALSAALSAFPPPAELPPPAGGLADPARSLNLLERQSLSIARRHCDFTRNVASGFYPGYPVRRCSRMAGGDCVSADEWQACKYKLALLVGLGVVFGVMSS